MTKLSDYTDAARSMLGVLAGHDYGRFGLDFRRAVDHGEAINRLRAAVGMTVAEAEAFSAELTGIANRAIHGPELFHQTAWRCLCQGESPADVLAWLGNLHPGRNPLLAVDARESMVRAMGREAGLAMFKAAYGVAVTPDPESEKATRRP